MLSPQSMALKKSCKSNQTKVKANHALQEVIQMHIILGRSLFTQCIIILWFFSKSKQWQSINANDTFETIKEFEQTEIP